MRGASLLFTLLVPFHLTRLPSPHALRPAVMESGFFFFRILRKVSKLYIAFRGRRTTEKPLCILRLFLCVCVSLPYVRVCSHVPSLLCSQLGGTMNTTTVYISENEVPQKGSESCAARRPPKHGFDLLISTLVTALIYASREQNARRRGKGEDSRHDRRLTDEWQNDVTAYRFAP